MHARRARCVCCGCAYMPARACLCFHARGRSRACMCACAWEGADLTFESPTLAPPPITDEPHALHVRPQGKVRMNFHRRGLLPGVLILIFLSTTTTARGHGRCPRVLGVSRGGACDAAEEEITMGTTIVAARWGNATNVSPRESTCPCGEHAPRPFVLQFHVCRAVSWWGPTPGRRAATL